MSKRGRLLPVIILLMIGGALCLSMLLVVNNPSFPDTTPTAIPESLYVSVHPTDAPTPELLQPEQCESTESAYQLQFVEYGATPFSEMASPDGRARLYSENRNLYLQPAQGETVTLNDTGAFEGSLSFQAFWSPDSRYVAYVLDNNSPLFVVAADGSDNHSIARLNYPLAFLGWSPDSRTLALQENYLADFSLWTVAGERLYSSAEGSERSLIVDQPPDWSSDGRWLSYKWRVTPTLNDTGLTPYGFTMVSADGTTSHDITLTEKDTPAEPIRQQYEWSPTGQFVAVTYLQFIGDSYQETVNIFDTSGRLMGEMGSLIEGMVYSDILNWYVDWNAIHWTANHQLVYTRPLAHDRFDLLLFDTNGQVFKTAYEGLPKPPFYPAQGLSGAVYLGQERPFNIEILTQDETRLPFIQNASDAGDPDWSPDGEWVASVWAVGEVGRRRLFLSWMHPDGSGRQDIDADFRDVRDLRWLNDGDSLAYVAWRGDEASIEIADTATGEWRTLVEGFSDVQDFNYDHQNQRLSFWWQTDDGKSGKAAYALDGTQIYRITYPPGFGLRSKEFWSPDGTMVALKSDLNNSRIDDEQLVLAYIDDRAPVVLRQNLSGLGDPLWSPDSQLLAFTQSRDHRPPTLEVVDTAGNDVWDFAPYPIGRQIAWEECATES
jgi:Tol biopolymer transport system component